LASAALIAQNNFDKKEVIILKEVDPLTDKNLWQQAIDGWLLNQTDERYKVPTEICDVPGAGVYVEIVTPKDRSRVDANEVEIRFEIFSDQDIEWADLYVDGVKERRFEGGPYEKVIRLDDGQHKIRVLARNSKGVESDRIHEFGVNADWVEKEATPTPIPTATVTPTATLTPTITAIPIPTATATLTPTVNP